MESLKNNVNYDTDVNKLYKIINEHVPLLNCAYNLSNSKDMYLDEISNFIELTCDVKTDPKNDFNHFIDTIINNSHIFKPENPEQCIFFIERCIKGDFGKFLFGSLFVAISNSNLFIKTLSYIRFKRQKIFSRMIKEVGTSEMFFDRLLPYLNYQIGNYTSSYWENRMIISDLLTQILWENYESILLVESYTSNLFKKITKLISDSPFPYSLEFTRHSLILLNFSRGKRELLRKRLMSILQSTPPCSECQTVVIKFIINEQDPQIFDKNAIVNFLIKNSRIATLWDYKALVPLCHDISVRNDALSLNNSLNLLAYNIFNNIILSRFSSLIFSMIINDNIEGSQNYLENLSLCYNIMLKLCEESGKYSAKRFRLLQMFSSSVFTQNFIDIMKQGESSVDFNTKLENARDDISSGVISLKYFPFVGSNLYSLNLTKKKTVKRSVKKASGNNTDKNSDQRTTSKPLTRRKKPTTKVNS